MRTAAPAPAARLPLLLSLLCAALLLVAACGQQPVTVFHTGSEGITLSFEKGMPPATVYEDSVVPLVVRLTNAGAWDVNYSDIVFNVKADPFYVNVTQDGNYEFAQARGDYGTPQDPSLTLLHGKQPGWPTGEFLDLQPIAEFKPIAGLREQPSTQLFASLCYRYATVLGTSLCVDANAFNGNVQQQVCGAQTLTFTDQGAPVAITSIENRPSPLRVAGSGGAASRDLVQPVFILHIANVGTGSVLTTATNDSAGLIAACGQGVSASPAVAINATLSSLQLECKPNPVPLRDNAGYTTCTLPASASGTLAAPNYLAAFRAQLGYVYQDSATADVEIQRVPNGVDAGQPSGPSAGDSAGFIDGMTRCEYCSANRNDPRCSDWPPGANQTASFSCACGEQECLQKAQHKPSECVYGSTWCAGTNYCCASG